MIQRLAAPRIFLLLFDYINKNLVEGASHSNHYNYLQMWIFKVELNEK
jgi:hypothetical protein